MSSTTFINLKIKVTGFGPIPALNTMIVQSPPVMQTAIGSSGGMFPSPVRRILTSMVHSSRGGGTSPLLVAADSEEKVSSSSSIMPLTTLNVSSNTSSTTEATDIYVTRMSVQSTVKELKKELFQILGPTCAGRYVRLIYAGRLLTPDSASLQTFFPSIIQSPQHRQVSGQEEGKDKGNVVVDDDDKTKYKPTIVLHAVFAPPGVRGGQQAELSSIGGGGGIEVDDTRLSPSSIFSRITSSRRNQNSNNNHPIVSRRGTGIRSDGVIVSPSSHGEYGDEDSDDDDEEDYDPGEDEAADVETGDNNARSHNHHLRNNNSRRRIRLGFDRLRRENGLSRDEINALRIYFGPQLNEFSQERQGSEQQQQQQQEDSSSNNTNNDDDPAERARVSRLQMEDAWMETQGPFSEFRLNLNSSNPLLTSNNLRWYRFGSRGVGGGGEGGSNIAMTSSLAHPPSDTAPMWMGTDRDFVWGFFLGFFVGFMMVFWVWLPTVSHKQKLGILTGLCCHLVIKLAQDTSAVEDRTAVVDLMQEISGGY